MKFFTAYLQKGGYYAGCRITGLLISDNQNPAGKGTAESAEVQALLQETRRFVPIAHFFWGVWALTQVILSPVEFGFAVGIFILIISLNNIFKWIIFNQAYGHARLQMYYETKKDLIDAK